jgi:hypothetical protein
MNINTFKNNNIAVTKISSLRKQQLKVCKVCDGVKDVFNNYGALTCHNCRIFFLMWNKRKLNGLKCIDGRERCKISQFGKKCSKCRITKCLRVGMRPTNPALAYAMVKTFSIKREQPEYINNAVQPHLIAHRLITNKYRHLNRPHYHNNVNSAHITNNRSASIDQVSSIQTSSSNCNEIINEKCKVCEDKKVNGIFYGVLACQSCRSFFAKRLYRDYLKRKCVFGDNQCYGDKSKLAQCIHCRYMRCIQVGMRSEAEASLRLSNNFDISNSTMVIQEQEANQSSFENNDSVNRLPVQIITKKENESSIDFLTFDNFSNGLTNNSKETEFNSQNSNKINSEAINQANWFNLDSRSNENLVENSRLISKSPAEQDILIDLGNLENDDDIIIL